MGGDLSAEVGDGDVGGVGDDIGDVGVGDLLSDCGQGDPSDAGDLAGLAISDLAADQRGAVDPDDHLGLPARSTALATNNGLAVLGRPGGRRLSRPLGRGARVAVRSVTFEQIEEGVEPVAGIVLPLACGMSGPEHRVVLTTQRRLDPAPRSPGPDRNAFH
ncbi:MAG: hypothetical protein ABGZ36_01535, partial [Actinomycetota bacterium]